MDYRQRIKNLREDNDKTQIEIAKILKVSIRTYKRYEEKNFLEDQNHLEAPKIIKLCELYNVSADYILFGKKDKN